MKHDPATNPSCELAEELAGRLVDIQCAVAAALTDHWQTRDMWGGEMRDACGRCTYGDGVPFLWPCPTRQALTGEPAPRVGGILKGYSPSRDEPPDFGALNRALEFGRE
jgi:hypothetical protein